MLHHSGSSLRFPNGRSISRARTRTLPHRAHLPTVFGPPSRAPHRPPARMPPLARPREGRFREASAGVGLRLRLPQDRRCILLGEHPASQAQRVDRARGYGSTQAHLPGGLRPPHRVGALGGGGGRGCITKAPCGGEKAGRSPGDRGKRGIKRSTAVDAKGIPIGGGVTEPASRHDSPLLWSLPLSMPPSRWEGCPRGRACIWIAATTRRRPASAFGSWGLGGRSLWEG